MTPSKNEPMERLLLSPPVPRTIEPSWCMGMYPPRVGSPPLYQVVRPPDWELPPLRAYAVWPLFFSSAVTNGVALPRFAVLEPLPPWNSPFSRSPATHGPRPVQG